eukprot:6907602-Pyramimonas_sp.AAC.1
MEGRVHGMREDGGGGGRAAVPVPRVPQRLLRGPPPGDAPHRRKVPAPRAARLPPPPAGMLHSLRQLLRGHRLQVAGAGRGAGH